MEYTSQLDEDTDFLDQDEKYKFIDDISKIEKFNLVLREFQVPSDIQIGNKFLHCENFKTQNYLDRTSD